MTLHEDTRGAVTWLTFDRPDRLNAFTAGAYRDLRLAFGRAAADEAVRVVVLTGAGRAFSAGADRSLVDGTATTEERELAGEEFEAVLDVVDRFDKPLLAAVNGLALGIGCTLLLHCDLVLVAGSARLRMPFTALGLAPEAGSSVLLPARARWGDAVWALLSSEWIDSETAVSMGLAWRAVPDADLVEETERAAHAIAAHDPAAVAATKRLLHEGRADAVRAAIARERAEMAALYDQLRG